MRVPLPSPGADTRRRRRSGAAPLLESVRRLGYGCATSLLAPDAVREIRDAIGGFDLADDHGFFASPAHRPGPMSRDFDLFVRDRVSTRLREAIPGHRPFMVAVTSKGARSEQEIKFHHDWTYTDERRSRAVFLWCPLVPVGPTNASLMVVPGSHHWSCSIRPSRPFEVTEPFQADYRRFARTCRLEAGDALAFDPATLHGSGPNRLNTPRPAITIALVPDDADLVHFHLDAEGTLSGAAVDDAFFTCHPYGEAPVQYPTIEPWAEATSEADVDPARHRELLRPRGWLRGRRSP